jgi:hypothetical protein
VVISLSAAVLLGVVVAVLLKQGYVRVGSALACALFGFTLASTGVAPAIPGTLSAFTGWISGL